MAETFMALGETTEARFRIAFAETATITAKAAAELVGLDVKTLRAMTEACVIAAVPRGSKPAYSEAVLRSYLTNPPPFVARKELEHCPSTSRRKAGSGSTTSSYRGSGFTDRPAKLRVVPQRP
jgi:hypothetical protein